ncbi:MAG: hypothetical protein ACP5G7_09205 [Anaerolineae bacterium]
MNPLAPLLDELSCQAHKYLMIADRRLWSAMLRMVAACEENPDAELRNGHAVALLLAAGYAAGGHRGVERLTGVLIRETLPPAPARSGGYPRIWYGYRPTFCLGADAGLAVGWLSRGAGRRRLTMLPDDGAWACWAEAPRRLDQVAELPRGDPSLVRVTRLGPRGVPWVHLVHALPPSAFHEELVAFLLHRAGLQMASERALKSDPA